MPGEATTTISTVSAFRPACVVEDALLAEGCSVGDDDMSESANGRSARDDIRSSETRYLVPN
jgi:hypothetical protein